MSNHAWCRDPSRDEAVRAAEDGREEPLPTLAQAISRAGQFAPPEAPKQQKCTERDSVTERRPPEPGGGGNVTGFAEDAKCSPAVSETGDEQSGLRTERVTLEIQTHSQLPVSEWGWQEIVEDSDVRMVAFSVRVVDTSAQAVADSVAWEGARDAYRGRIARVTAERDAAIRERDELRKECKRRLTMCERMKQEKDQANFHVAIVQARVAELESAAKLAPAANADGGSNHAPAASGAAGTEPLAWGRRSKATGKITFVTAEPPVCHWSHEDIVPLYAAPQPASGWLTAEERDAVEWFSRLDGQQYSDYCQHCAGVAKSLLARATPPEVVLPDDSATLGVMRTKDVVAALAAAGVNVKEVGK